MGISTTNPISNTQHESSGKSHRHWTNRLPWKRSFPHDITFSMSFG